SLEALALRAEVEEALLDEKKARDDADQVISRFQTSRKQWQAAVRAQRLVARLLVMTNDPNDVKRAAKYAKDAVDNEGGEQTEGGAQAWRTLATCLLHFRIQLHPSFADTNAEPLEKHLKDAIKKHGSSTDAKRVLALIAQVRAGNTLGKAKDRVQSAVKADPM